MITYKIFPVIEGMNDTTRGLSCFWNVFVGVAQTGHVA